MLPFASCCAIVFESACESQSVGVYRTSARELWPTRDMSTLAVKSDLGRVFKFCGLRRAGRYSFRNDACAKSADACRCFHANILPHLGQHWPLSTNIGQTWPESTNFGTSAEIRPNRADLDQRQEHVAGVEQIWTRFAYPMTRCTLASRRRTCGQRGTKNRRPL